MQQLWRQARERREGLVRGAWEKAAAEAPVAARPKAALRDRKNVAEATGRC